jgi:hypothetical protein
MVWENDFNWLARMNESGFSKKFGRLWTFLKGTEIRF